MTGGESHWREYAIEGALLGLFMIAACVLTTALEHPGSLLRASVPDAFARRVAMGTAMGLTAVALVKSPWGRTSGAHMNPAMTLAWFRLGRVRTVDAVGYVAAQFAGGAAGVGAVALAIGAPVGHPSVRYASTVPGKDGIVVAFAAEFFISALLMFVVLVVSNRPRLARFTPWCCGLLVALYISFEAPLSGMSMNPARSMASALGARDWSAMWIYFAAPVLGMLTAAEAFVRVGGVHRVLCAKLDHDNAASCIFLCRWPGA